MAEEKATLITPRKYGESYRGDFINMYHEYAATAERISERRGNANTFFVTANAALLGATEFLGASLEGIWMPCVAGVLMCIIWRGLISSYKSLNTAKFVVIQEMEQSLPAQPFTREWEVLQQAQSEKTHTALSDHESNTPIAFGALYILLALFG